MFSDKAGNICGGGLFRSSLTGSKESVFPFVAYICEDLSENFFIIVCCGNVGISWQAHNALSVGI